jgi:hypothetical protein
VPTSAVTAAGDMAHQNPSRTEKVPVRAVCGREGDPLALVVHKIADDRRHDVTIGHFADGSLDPGGSGEREDEAHHQEGCGYCRDSGSEPAQDS